MFTCKLPYQLQTYVPCHFQLVYEKPIETLLLLIELRLSRNSRISHIVHLYLVNRRCDRKVACTIYMDNALPGYKESRALSADTTKLTFMI